MKKSLFISLLCGLTFVYSACDEYDDTYPQKYHKILSLKQTGEENVILYKTGQDASFDISVMKSGYDPSLTAQGKLTVLSEEALNEYNGSYTLLPATTYSIEGSDMDFQSDELYKMSKVIMKTDEIQALMEIPGNADKTFVLPISLVSSTDSVNSLNNLYVMKPVVTIPKVMFKVSEEECVKGFTSSSEPVVFTIPLGMEVDNLWDFTAQIEVVNNDEKFGYLSSNTVTLENNGIVTFEPGKDALLKVAVSAGEGNDLTNFVVGGKVGIKIKEVNGLDFDFDNKEFVLTVTGKEYEYNGKGLNATMLSNNFSGFADGTNAGSLFDKDPATYVQTPYPNRNFSSSGGENPYLQLTLPVDGGVTDFAVSITQVAAGSTFLKGFRIECSVDGTFTDLTNVVKSYTLEELTTAGAIAQGASFTTSACHSERPVRYIRLIQTVSFDDDMSAGSRWHFRLGELRLYGVSIQ